MNATDAPEFHADRIWGEAAIYFSLDLSSALWEFLETGLDYKDVLQINRKSILENRRKNEKSQFSDDGVISQISTIARTHAAALRAGTASYSRFVEEKFSGFQGYSCNAYFFNPALFDCLNFKENFRKQLKSELGDEFDLNLANRSFDDHRAMQLHREALQIDRTIEAGSLSAWDRELLAKHRGVLGAIDPLGTVVQLAIRQLKNQAVEKSTAKLKPDIADKLQSIFKRTIGIH